MSDLVVLQTFNYRHEAELVQSMLDARGIRSTIVADDVGSLDPALDLVLGTRLVVAPEDLEQAREALEGHEPASTSGSGTSAS
jgi:hypothetical protein